MVTDARDSQVEGSMDSVLVEREERGPVSVLTMVYRPYNLLGTKLISALAGALSENGAKGFRLLNQTPIPLELGLSFW